MHREVHHGEPREALGLRLRSDIKHVRIPSESLDIFTIGNVAAESRWLWVHCVALYIISGAAFILLYIEYKHIARLRLLHLTSTRSNPRHFTVLVRGKKSKEIENLAKEKQELQEKFAEKSRQKRKLDEMYDKLRTEYDSLKRSAIQPANNLFPRAQPELFAGMPNMMDSNNHLRQGRRDEMWAPAPRQRLANSDTFEMSGGSGHMGAPPVDARPRKPAGSVFGAATNNPSVALRNMLISPVERPQLSRNRSNMFT